MRYLRLTAAFLFIMLLVACGSEPNPPAATLPATTIPTLSAAPTESVATSVPADSRLVQGTEGFPWWNDTVFYEIFVRSFYDSDGDGIGDLNGLIKKLDYLNDGDPSTTTDLGVTGIWLMPIMKATSYHGYDVEDYYQVAPEYGSNEDFQRLIEEAHARGMRVIVDLVLNHTSVEHPWFEASRDPNSDKRSWYIWSDTDPGYRGPNGQTVWHRTTSGFYYGVFWSGMPDLNYENPAVTTQMQDITRFWLEEMQADGFRLDAIKHMIEQEQAQENTPATHEWLQAYYTFYKSVAADAFTVGEAWTSTQQVLRYTGNEVDVAFQFDLALAALNSADSGFGIQVGKEQQAVVAAFPSGQYATFLTNHDQNRVLSQLDGDENKARVAASWLLTSPGVPFIYYGEEIGQEGEKPDEDIRRPMQWTGDSYRVGFTTGNPWRAPAADYETRNVSLQNETPDSLLNHYRRLIHLRNAYPALRIGDWLPVETNSPRVYAYVRHSQAETLLVLINFSDDDDAKYQLTLAEGPLPDAVSTTLLLGAAAPAPLAPNAQGGFDEYQPYGTLPAFSTTILQLTP
ncbi:MAG: alpha-amylase family glycosyl hydrolase [Candidatus Promineifilaceae bacterium]